MSSSVDFDHYRVGSRNLVLPNDTVLPGIPVAGKGKFPITLSASGRTAFNSCPRRYYEKYILGYVPSEKSIHLVAGGAYAAGLDTLRKAYFLDGQDMDDALTLGIIAMIRHWGDFDVSIDLAKSLYRMCDTLIEYAFQYPLSNEWLVPVETEFTFAIPIPGTSHPDTGEPILYIGVLDVLGRGRSDGVYWVLDDKTTGQMGITWPIQWKLSSQMTGYIWAVREYGYEVTGALIRGMCILKTMYKVQDVPVIRPTWKLAQWEARLTNDVARMIECYNTDYWPSTGEESGSCSEYGGCPYMPICESANPQGVREVYFTERTPSPMEQSNG